MRGIDYSDAPRFGRTAGIRRALGCLHDIRDEAVIIVETGATRGALGGGVEGDGWATLAWGWYCRKYGGLTHTIDFSREAIEECRRITRDYADVITYHTGDSVAVIRTLEPPVHLLYLDSADDPGVILREIQTARRLLTPGALVLIDDTDMRKGTWNGKGAVAVPWLAARGWAVAFEDNRDRQVMLRREGIVAAEKKTPS